VDVNSAFVKGARWSGDAEAPALVKHRQMPGNITRDASRAGDKVRSVRERGNKLPGKLRYTSVSIHRRDSHVREGRRPVNRARKLKSSTAAAVKPTRRARARAGGEKARTNDDVTTPGRGGGGRRGGGGIIIRADNRRRGRRGRNKQTRREKRRYQARIFITSRSRAPSTSRLEYPRVSRAIQSVPLPPRPVIYQLPRGARGGGRKS